MLRLMGCAIAAMVFVITSSTQAGEFSDRNNTFRLTAPDGWATEPPSIPTLSLAIASPRKPETGGNCNVVVAPVDATRSISQTEAEAQFFAQLKESDWKTAVAAIRGHKSSTIETWEERTHRGRKALHIKSTSTFGIDGDELTITQVQDFHPIPGRLYAVTCTALAAGFEQEANDFAAIMASFEPLPDMTVGAVRMSPRASPGDRFPVAHAAIAVIRDAGAAGVTRVRVELSRTRP